VNEFITAICWPLGRHVSRVVIPPTAKPLFVIDGPNNYRYLFSSNPRGHNEEGWNDGRYGTHLDLETWGRVVSSRAL
jgi:hypothetical protein